MQGVFFYRWMLLAGLILIISLLHYLTPASNDLSHLMYRELYLLPIFLASFWYGVRGGLISSLVSTTVYLPSFLRPIMPLEVQVVGNLMQVGVFILFGLTFGIMRDRDFRRQQEQSDLAGLAAMGQAVSSIAHDLKSPLMAIGGFATQVRRKLDDKDPSAPKMDIVIAQAEHMENMVKDMLAFARPLQLRKQETDLNSLVNQVAEVAQAAATKTCKIEVELDQETPKLRLDNDRMQQALLNLVNNSIEASPENGSVRVVAKQDQGILEIEVSDQGPGIAPENQSELFTPFVTTKKGGTGLGLNISKKILEAHGGKLALKETSPDGTKFTIQLPLPKDSPLPADGQACDKE